MAIVNSTVKRQLYCQQQEEHNMVNNLQWRIGDNNKRKRCCQR